MMRKTKTIYGASLTENQQVLPPIPSLVNIPCFREDERFTLQLGEETLSKHILLIGGIGSGKTNLLYYIVDAIKEKMAKNDIMLIFDTKGDYISKFFRADTGMILLLPTVIDHFFLRKDTNGRGNSVRFVNGVLMGVGFVLIIRSTLIFI